jgi:hypothetical protein
MKGRKGTDEKKEEVKEKRKKKRRITTTTETIFRPPRLSRSVLGSGPMKVLVPGPMARGWQGALVPVGGSNREKHLVPGGHTNHD